MRKSYTHLALLLMANLLTIASLAQQNFAITGNVRDSATKEVVPAVSIVVKGTPLGAFTDDNGNFKVTVLKLPVTLVVSSIGYASQQVDVSSIATTVNIQLAPTIAMGQAVVVLGSRVPERILESPVSIERVGPAAK